MNLQPFPVQNARQALALLHLAHTRGLRASWHPHGGDTRTKIIPITHTVWVMGAPDALHKLEREIR